MKIAIFILFMLGLAWAQSFVNEPDGYALDPPPNFHLDTSLLPWVARWEGEGTTVRVFAQPVRDQAAAEEYVGYSNRSIDQGWNGIVLLAREQSDRGWYREWRRPAMAVLEQDQSFYAQWDLYLSRELVLTVMVNSLPELAGSARQIARQVADSARIIPANGVHAYRPHRAPARKPPLVPPVETPLQLGIFMPGLEAYSGNLWPVHRREAELGIPLRVILTYHGLGRPFPARLVQSAWREGRLAEVTLQSWAPSSDADRHLPYDRGISRLGEILNGNYDPVLRRFAREAKATGATFFFRFDNEMNGDWSPWSAFQWGKDTDIYQAAWRHVHQIFREEGAVNAVFVWNPNNQDLPPYRWNAAPLYYPGDSYVDWVGLTAYNRGDATPGDTWRGFGELYDQAYRMSQALYPEKPLLITEFASHDSPGNKLEWIREALQEVCRYPAIRYAVWWDGQEGDYLNYRLDQPPEALAAFRAGWSGCSQTGSPGALPPPAR